MFPKLLTILGLASAALLINGEITSKEAMDIVINFLDSYLYPKNAEVAASVNSTLFAEDVKGTVDVSTNFDGRELATEYLFGLFVNLAKDPTEPSPIGNPIGYEIHAAIAHGNTVFVGVKFDFYYGALNQSFPIEIDALFSINDDLQVQEYDLIFRRWAWATDLIVPRLQYANHDECLTFLNGLPLGQFYRLGENNLGCRYLHTPMLSFRPNVHCPHVGPSGGDMCVPRNYTEVVKAKHFPQGFVTTPLEDRSSHKLGLDRNLEAVNLAD
ncbi:hypothetical protein V865_007868 [Kwoniella europaea PYCC6329]|uniref:Uncharacterized protein n=1 Tax=Kwoniella europaea PYCC6329 TaxID=1423913 RepID=A0AAX4KTJ5_9TREE